MTQFGGLTTEVSSHHVYWYCSKESKGYGDTADITDKTCKTCKKTRCAGDDALAASPENGKTFEIGHLHFVDEKGHEHWCFVNPDAEKQSEISCSLDTCVKENGNDIVPAS
ncbi:hypothetical protein FNAPI_8338 [Fusarium napiforme]|uniref:Uncharacterized protein n=1 Tax=Fusarium napiforme TaxID=42672 RepID=A0A8H5J3F9_9HYPO|nr:hypothetical protein FNAPI_8338 [Fusarium napiforme]